MATELSPVNVITLTQVDRLQRFGSWPWVVLIALLGSTLFAGCSELSDLSVRTESTSFQDTRGTRLGQAIAPRLEMHSGGSGVVALANGLDAFAARALLIDTADRSIDVQYYIWQEDLSGTLLFEALQRAADRGVRVRLLLDDNRTSGMDERLAALDAHPSIEVRLFNPFKFRDWRVLEYIADFGRVNRRMHNKSFIVDNQVAVIGGRNIGDEYFEATHDGVMYDLDVLAIGTVVVQMSEDFDRYWASDSSYPADLLLRAADTATVSALRVAAAQMEAGSKALAYKKALEERPKVHDLISGQLPFEWATTHLISDDPAKALETAAPSCCGTRSSRGWGRYRTGWSLFHPTSCRTPRVPFFARYAAPGR